MRFTNIENPSVNSPEQTLSIDEIQKLRRITLGHGKLKAAEIASNVSVTTLRKAMGGMRIPDKIDDIRAFLNTQP